MGTKTTRLEVRKTTKKLTVNFQNVRTYGASAVGILVAAAMSSSTVIVDSSVFVRVNAPFGFGCTTSGPVAFKRWCACIATKFDNPTIQQG